MIRLTQVVALTLFGSSALAAPNHEKMVLEQSQNLKPVTDAEWANIAAGKISEEYEIVRGDTLYDISNMLFGDSMLWPKVWALNNTRITNPHKIEPGFKVIFRPGTASSLPSVSLRKQAPPQVARTSSPTGKPYIGDYKLSDEWKKLPRQRWEHSQATLPEQIDPHGFDKSARVKFRNSRGIDLQTVARTDKIDPIAEITGSRSPSTLLGLGDTVYIQALRDLQVGELYTVTEEPQVLKSRESDRTGWAYQIKGTVKIIGVRQNLFIGRIVSGKSDIRRGDVLVPYRGNIKRPDIIPGLNPIDGVIMFDRRLSTFLTAQFKYVFIDRGSDDGVKPGMVFRAYQHYDPSNEKKITSSDFIIDADIIVLETSQQFSTGYVLRSLNPVVEHSLVVLLTDVSDLLDADGFNTAVDLDHLDQDLDDLELLDQLDQDAIGRDEERELRQLERWKEGEGKETEGAPSEEDELPENPEFAEDEEPTEEIPTADPQEAQEDDEIPEPTEDEVAEDLAEDPAEEPPPPDVEDEVEPEPEPAEPIDDPADETENESFDEGSEVDEELDSELDGDLDSEVDEDEGDDGDDDALPDDLIEQ